MVKQECCQQITGAQRDAAAISGYLELPLQMIDSWEFREKHAWLKCMLTKHIDSQLMNESHASFLREKLVAIDSEMRCHPDLPLDSLIDIVERQLDLYTAGKLRVELEVWRQAAGNEDLLQLSQQQQQQQQQQQMSTQQRPASRQPSSSGGSGGSDLLWQHILRLLMTSDPSVRWLQPADQGLFQFICSSRVAKSWGRTKNNENMSFEKMSRSIRQYYRQRSGVIQKLPQKARLQYKFNLSHPDVVRFILENFPGFSERLKL